jgi:hypothetical protein
MTDSPEEYRQKAARLREEAERATFPAIRDMLRNIASQYDQLAEASERLSGQHRA